MRVGAAFLFWREPVLPAEGQRGVDAADAVSGAGIADTARAAAQQQKRQAVRLHIGAARRRLRRVRREPDLRPRKGGKRGLQLFILKHLSAAASCARLLSSSFSRCSVGSRPSSSHIRRDCVRVSSAAAA